MLFQFPEIGQIETDMEADRPVVIFPGDGILERLSLRVTLDEGVVGVNIIQARRIEDGGAGFCPHMCAARPMAALAADITFCDGFHLAVVVYRMTALPERAGGGKEIGG